MVRVWNYNKSRIHSSRGAREVEMLLDGELVFQGEIAQARGALSGGTEAFGEVQPWLQIPDPHLLTPPPPTDYPVHY